MRPHCKRLPSRIPLRRSGEALDIVAKDRGVGYPLPVPEYVTSSLFESPAQTLVNTVNTVGVMGKGIASDFKRLYPDMYQRYRAFCKNGQLEVGQLYLYRSPHKWVLNFPTKEHWRNPSRLEWIEAGLEKFVTTYSARGITSVAFPQLGTGNGGLSWETVRPVMERHLRNLRIPVYIHIRQRTSSFVPEHLSSEAAADLRDDLQTARGDISFEQFINDLSAFGVLKSTLLEDPESLPAIDVVVSEGQTLRVSGEQMLDFWTTLKLQGAVEVSALHASLHEAGALLEKKLLLLDYIKPMQLGREERPGLRYAPPSVQRPFDAIELNPE